jgi:hypothetical protein
MSMAEVWYQRKDQNGLPHRYSRRRAGCGPGRNCLCRSHGRSARNLHPRCEGSQAFPRGARLYVQLDRQTPLGGKSVVAQIHDFSLDTLRVFATIELQDVLYLQLRGTKPPTLSDTPCKIPALNNGVARSVNHASSMLSEVIEKQRMSHAVNARRRGVRFSPFSCRWEATAQVLSMSFTVCRLSTLQKGAG